MIRVRRAVADDAAELVRLREVMLAAVHGIDPGSGRWQRIARATLSERLADPDGAFAAFVADDPERPGTLASCAIGSIDHRLGGPENPSGEVGYVFSVATDPGHRRRGYARACMEALLGWYRERGVTKIDLRASEAAEPLYRSLGFARTAHPTLRLTLPPVVR